jgi:hypothetical protein
VYVNEIFLHIVYSTDFQQRKNRLDDALQIRITKPAAARVPPEVNRSGESQRLANALFRAHGY